MAVLEEIIEKKQIPEQKLNSKKSEPKKSDPEKSESKKSESNSIPVFVEPMNSERRSILDDDDIDGDLETETEKKERLIKQEKDQLEKEEREKESTLLKNIAIADEYKIQGNDCFKSGVYSTAIDLYTSAINSVPYDLPRRSIYFANRAAAYLKMNSWPEALGDCTAALSLNPKYDKALVRRAQSYEGIEDYESALEDWELLRKVKKSSTIAVEGIKRCRSKLGLPEETLVVEPEEPKEEDKLGDQVKGYLNRSKKGLGFHEEEKEHEKKKKEEEKSEIISKQKPGSRKDADVAKIRWQDEFGQDIKNLPQLSGYHGQNEIDWTHWSKERLNELLSLVSSPQRKDGFSKTVKLEEMTGEAFHRFNKGRRYVVYDLYLKVRWRGITTVYGEYKKVEGWIEFFNVNNENETAESYEHKVSIDPKWQWLPWHDILFSYAKDIVPLLVARIHQYAQDLRQK